MKFELVILLIAGVCLLTTLASPINDETVSFVDKKSKNRPKRTPGGHLTLEGSSDRGTGGYKEDKLKAEYSHRLWGNKDGARVEANGYYERNWGNGPKKDYGVGLNAKIPF